MKMKFALLGALTMALSLGNAGCLKEILINGTIDGTRDGSDAVDTLHDFEIARSVALSGMAGLEGLYSLEPDNENGLFMLTAGWAGTATFPEDDWETALEKNDDLLAQYHKQRMIASYKRARFYAKQLITHVADGFDEARRNHDTLKPWLKENFAHKDEADDLAVIGWAWVGLVGAASDVPEIVSELWVGIDILERSVELDETAENGLAHIVLGSCYAYSALAEMEKGKKHFDRAIQITKGAYLPAKLQLARNYYCNKRDKENYEKTLREVLNAPDAMPEARLANVVAKRKARRYLEFARFQEDCGFELGKQTEKY